MAQAIFKAAKNSGIGLTLLPVLYQYAGFGQQEPSEGQKRFINATEQFNQLVSDCFELTKQYPNTNIGIAPHSLRAVDKEAIIAAVKHVRSLDDKAPIHIHIAEQQQEVTDCLQHYSKRPVQWLLDNIELDEHWCLIHATHINEQEQQGIIASKAIAGICPTTEANLGDGIFPTAEFLALNGTFAIGSDSLFERLAGALGHPDWAEDANYKTMPERLTHRDEVDAMVQAKIAKHSRAYWLETLAEAGVPCTPIQDLADICEDEQVAALNILTAPADGEVPLTALPLSIDGIRPALHSSSKL